MVIEVDTAFDIHERLDFSTPDCFDYRRSLQPRITTTYAGDPVDSTELERIRTEFTFAVHLHWNDKLWLVPSHGAFASLACQIQINMLQPGIGRTPHLRVALIKNPRQVGARRSYSHHTYPEPMPFRASCAPNLDNGEREYDMTLDWRGPGSWDVTHESVDNTGRPVRLSQNVVAHEFGHYLGLEHSCHSAASEDVGWCNYSEGTESDYCDMRSELEMNRLMAMGNRIAPENGWPWAHRMMKWHHYGCDAGYRPSLVSAP